MQGHPPYAIPRDYKSRLSRYLMSLDFCDRWIAIASRLPRIESSHFRHFDHSPGCGCFRIPESDYSLVARLNFTYSAGGRVHLCDPFRDFNSNSKTLYQSALIHAREHVKTLLNASDFCFSVGTCHYQQWLMCVNYITLSFHLPRSLARITAPSIYEPRSFLPFQFALGGPMCYILQFCLDPIALWDQDFALSNAIPLNHGFFHNICPGTFPHPEIAWAHLREITLFHTAILDEFTVKMFDDHFPECAQAIRQQQQLGRKTILFRHD